MENNDDNIGNIIVRVKRRRDQEPVDRLCIVEESILPDRKKVKDLIDNFVNLNQANDNDNENTTVTSNVQSLILSRIQTFQKSNDVDSQTIITATTINSNNNKRERNDEDNDEEHDNNNITNAISNNKIPAMENRTWITQGKKYLRLSDTDSFVVVDLNQETISDDKEKSVITVDDLGETSNKEQNTKKVKILDPPHRRLDLAIEKARVTLDFTDMNSALLLGANINYQRNENKQTCLMIAVMHANVRMVAKLLMKDVDIFAEDCEGRAAYDYVEKNCNGSKRGATLEIVTMLQNAKMKAFQLGNYKKKTVQNSIKISSSDVENTNDEDYVFDIFMVNNNDNIIDSDKHDNRDTFDGPRVKIEGLHILDDGRGELVHHYDSDWSDLADDEDVDSNDERYEGNDYPEEEDYSDSDSYDKNTRRAGFNNNDDDYNVEDYDDDDKYNDIKFPQNNIGRVQHYSTQNDPFADLNRDQKALRELWGEENDDYDEEFNEEQIDYEDTGVDALKEHRERVMAMRERSGLTFASNPREFNARGLPKYGQDISDDEFDEKLLQEAYEETEQYYEEDNKNRFITARPPKNSVAFDPEMDLSDSD